MWNRRTRKSKQATLSEILLTLKGIEDNLATMNKVASARTEITVENLHVNQANLERLNFRLDALEIQELSGALNLGNNFGIKVNREQQTDDFPGSKARGTVPSLQPLGTPLWRSQLLGPRDPVQTTGSGYKRRYEQE